MRKLSKKGKVYAAAATIALVAASGGAAYAYWTTTGSGSGGAANSAAEDTVTPARQRVAARPARATQPSVRATMPTTPADTGHSCCVTALIASGSSRGPACLAACDSRSAARLECTVGHNWPAARASAAGRCTFLQRYDRHQPRWLQGRHGHRHRTAATSQCNWWARHGPTSLCCPPQKPRKTNPEEATGATHSGVIPTRRFAPFAREPKCFWQAFFW